MASWTAKYLDRGAGVTGKKISLLDHHMLLTRRELLSINKSRKLGWHGFVDSHDSLIKVFEELADLKMIPTFKGPETIEPHYNGY